MSCSPCFRDDQSIQAGNSPGKKCCHCINNDMQIAVFLLADGCWMWLGLQDNLSVLLLLVFTTVLRQVASCCCCCCWRWRQVDISCRWSCPGIAERDARVRSVICYSPSLLRVRVLLQNIWLVIWSLCFLRNSDNVKHLNVYLSGDIFIFVCVCVCLRGSTGL